MERNHWIFCNSILGATKLWQLILPKLQETISAKCDMSEPVDLGDSRIVRNLGLVDKGFGTSSSKRSQPRKRKVCRVGRWSLPPDAVLKINIDGSSRGNPGLVGVGGIGRDAYGNVIFILSIHKGVQSNNVMEA